MSSQPDPRHDALIEALRADRPVAGESVRARVAALGEMAAVEERRQPSHRGWHVPWRVALVAVPVVVAVVAAGFALERLPSGGGDNDAVEASGAVTAPQAAGKSSEYSTDPAEEQALGAVGSSRNGALEGIPPSGRRLQSYRANLRVHVGSTDALSTQTTAAMRITRGLGGFVASARFAQPGDGDGDSRLVVRVPVDKVSRAVMRFSALGSVIGQDVSIQDLQRRFDRQSQTVERLRTLIAGLREELQRTDLTEDERVRLRERIAAEQVRLTSARGARQGTLRSGRLATVSLTLTTREGAELQPPPPPGRFEQTLRDALTVLATLLTWLVAAAIVAGPFVLLVLGAVALERRRRRRADARLLDAAA